jgi:hypothetical protein
MIGLLAFFYQNVSSVNYSYEQGEKNHCHTAITCLRAIPAAIGTIAERACRKSEVPRKTRMVFRGTTVFLNIEKLD